MASSDSSSGLIKAVFLAHLVLSSWGMESPFLVPTGYLYYNLIFMMSLIWAVSCINTDSAAMALLITLACIVMDAFALTFWPRGGPPRERVYYGIGIANAVLRGITALLLFRLFRARDKDDAGMAGVFGDVVGAFNQEFGGPAGKGRGREGYEPIRDEREQQQSSSSSGERKQRQGDLEV